MERIVSLLPATTEIVCALGLGSQLIGRSHECDFPEDANELPVCSEPKHPFEGNSYDIDQKVKAVISEGLAIYRVNAEKLKTLNPDIILTQDQCEVCAVNQKELEVCLNHYGIDAEILSFSPETLQDILDDIQRIAQRLGAHNKGEDLVREIRQRFDQIRTKTASSHPVHVEVIEWIDPLMTAGNWMPELIETAGGYSTLAKRGEHSPFVDFRVIKEADPDILVIIPCGYGVQETMAELDTLKTLKGWYDLQAVKKGQVYIADGHQFFNRPGPRIADSSRILAEIIHPKLFEGIHRGTVWIKIPD